MKTTLRLFGNFAFLLLFLLIVAPLLHAQDVGAGLPTDLGPLGLSTNTQLHLTWAIIAFKYASELWSSVRNGGGLKRIILSFWLGENLPKAVATDYKAELSNPPFPPKP